MSKLESAVYNWMEAHPTAWEAIHNGVFWGAIAVAVIGALILIALSLIVCWERHRERLIPWLKRHQLVVTEESEEER